MSKIEKLDYFVKDVCLEDLQRELNAFIEQGWKIDKIFEYKDAHTLPRFIIICQKIDTLNKLTEDKGKKCGCGQAWDNHDPEKCKPKEKGYWDIKPREINTKSKPKSPQQHLYPQPSPLNLKPTECSINMPNIRGSGVKGEKSLYCCCDTASKGGIPCPIHLPKPKTLETVIKIATKDAISTECEEAIIFAIRTHIKEITERCLTENDSDTHIIVKDLLEAMGITE